jgi:hypothetical protein
MIDHLATILEAFLGTANRTRCFTHILNLVAKCIMRQFDIPKKQENCETDLDGLTAALDDLEGELEDEPEAKEASEIKGKREQSSDTEEDVGLDELLNGREGLTAAEVEALEASIRPVRLVLSKVS